jgi:hypothetical protein
MLVPLANPGGLTVRQWLSSKSYAEQFEFGIKVILMKW